MCSILHAGINDVNCNTDDDTGSKDHYQNEMEKSYHRFGFNVLEVRGRRSVVSDLRIGKLADNK